MRIELPTIQNWSCHNCGGCCRQHLIEITEEERARIEDQNWPATEGWPVGQPIVEWHAGPSWKKRYRLAHQADGGCVFLDKKGLCRIHAKFGEPAKPLACRVYPYALHPSAKGVTVSLRYSCPSVVANKGQAVTQQRADLEAIHQLVVPPHQGGWPVPAVSPLGRVDWPDFEQFVAALDADLCERSVPIAVRIARTILWMNLVQEARFDEVRGKKLREFQQLLRAAAAQEIPGQPKELTPVSPMGQLYFRTALAQYARKDTVADLRGGWLGRWRLLKAILQFSRGKGLIPPLQDGFRKVPFARIDEPFHLPVAEQDELFERYFRVKLKGLHFCGPAYYDIPLAEGWHSLALMLPIVSWLARWLAASEDRDRVELRDLEKALTVADHHHGYSPALGAPAARKRIRSLSQTGDLQALIWRYSTE